ncbi:MAG: hypothetical protein ACR2FK_00720 [Sphingomicrobium sp.]
MAKAKTASADKKKSKPAAAKSKAGAKKPGTKKGGQKAKPKSEHKGFEALAKLADHPLVIDLIAIGATAAVAALASRGGGGKAASKSSRPGTAVKAAGQAAAAAIGQRLVAEYEAVKDAAETKKKKKA